MLTVNLNNPKTRPFLKWAGNKYRLLERIIPLLPPGKKLIEPFVGSAALFLNTNYAKYLLADANPDLISLYQIIQQQGDNFIDVASAYFKPKYNNAEKYYALRERFNKSKSSVEKAALFLYLNRHCYNGLCRYNNQKHFNVPFGLYVKPYFPVTELQHFHRKAQTAEFICADFSKILPKARSGDVVYCDPPYVPLTLSANFTTYSGKIFSMDNQALLATMAQKLAVKNIPVLLSNHNTPLTRQLYEGAEQLVFPVRRTISSNGSNRAKVSEILALYKN